MVTQDARAGGIASGLTEDESPLAKATPAPKWAADAGMTVGEAEAYRRGMEEAARIAQRRIQARQNTAIQDEEAEAIAADIRSAKDRTG